MHSELPVRDDLFDTLGYNYINRRVTSGSALCCTPMHTLRGQAEEMLSERHQMSTTASKEIIDKIWKMPDPRKLARPLVELPVLFEMLHSFNVKIAVSTTDDRAATVATLEHLGVRDYVPDHAIAAGDDPIPPKPNPQQIWKLCHAMGVSAQDTLMVGDTNTDMTMGRAAGCGLTVGVLDGASSIKDLSEKADVLVPTIGKIPKIIYQFLQHH